MSNLRTQGFAFALAAITLFSLQDGISKHLAEGYSPAFVTMVRYWAFGLFTLVLSSRMPGGLRAVARSNVPLVQIARGVLLALQVIVAITCFAVIGLARSQAIFSATPILVMLLSVPLLGERIGWARWAAIAAGLAGVLLILKPSGDFFDAKVLLAVGTSLMFALYVVATRYVGRRDASITSFLYTGVGGAVATSLIGPFFWTPFHGWDWGWMSVVCMTSISSHYCLIRAYDILDASAVQPLTYLSLVYASIIGTTVFGETLSWTIVLGSAVVVAAGVFAVWREHGAARRETTRR
ncbi:DMT family transporter [Labrys wisconsinensis]|uniref:Drug/metabolite transporter (DMT)-like permease n=1 Tax=Labrys wisconsinensis TaxID=425677 RepID=A0ABU0J0U1_9HYPH|nr:DMT family transporter [Labrys wisconsinensis]MDQ0467869.1 drug/metabolite transporter (DMT)-like permease [Labrys wisconsinensis]